MLPAMHIRTSAALAVLACLAALPAGAQAATTLGSTIAATQASAACPGDNGCATVQEKLPGRLTTAPADGVIVRWRVRGAGTFAIAPVTYTGDDLVVRSQGTVTHLANS